MHHLASLLKYSRQFQLSKYRFQITSVCTIFPLTFKLFAAVITFKTSFQIASECTILPTCFQNLLSSSNFQNRISNTVRMHQLASLVFKSVSVVPTSRTSSQKALECTLYWRCFQHFLSISNFQKQRSNSTRMHLLIVSLVSKISQQCQLCFIDQCLR